MISTIEMVDFLSVVFFTVITAYFIDDLKEMDILKSMLQFMIWILAGVFMMQNCCSA